MKTISQLIKELEHYYNLDEIAALVGVSPATIRRWKKQRNRGKQLVRNSLYNALFIAKDEPCYD